ncbi:MAG: hypothetical protein WA840_22885 [Caulobacteraceae bacterium]
MIRAGIGFVLGLTLCVSANARDSQYRAVDPENGKFALGGFTVDLGEGDKPANASDWQGPIVIHQPNATCTVDPDVAIIERPLFWNGTHLLVTTYSGSHRQVYILAAKDCRVVWHSAPFIGSVRVAAGAVVLGGRKIPLDR